MNKVVANADEAIRDVFDGAAIMIGGFGLCGMPENLIRALQRKGTKNLHTISNNVGVDGVGNGLLLAAGQIDGALGYSFRVYVDLKARGVPIDDIVLLPMSNYGLKAYGSAILVNTKFAAEKPEAVKGFLRAFLKGLKDTVRNPAAAIDSLLKREDDGQKEVELERLRMAIRDNILTPETRTNGLGAIDPRRLDDSIAQIATVYAFKSKPKAEELFDANFLPPSADRRDD